MRWRWARYANDYAFYQQAENGNFDYARDILGNDGAQSFAHVSDHRLLEGKFAEDHDLLATAVMSNRKLAVNGSRVSFFGGRNTLDRT